MAATAVTTAQAGRVTNFLKNGRYAQLVGGGSGSPIYLSSVIKYIAADLLGSVVIANGGVLPNIHHILLPKKNAKGKGEIGYVSRILDGFRFVGIGREEERVRLTMSSPVSSSDHAHNLVLSMLRGSDLIKEGVAISAGMSGSDPLA
ncbi:PREDICTED: histone H2A.1-like [Fragaria vesca subsp. vesca]